MRDSHLVNSLKISTIPRAHVVVVVGDVVVVVVVATTRKFPIRRF